MKKFTKRIFGIVLAVAMLASMAVAVPLTAKATDIGNCRVVDPTTDDDFKPYYYGKKILIHNDMNLKEQWDSKDAKVLYGPGRSLFTEAG